MPRLVIVDSKIGDVYRISSVLRLADRREIDALGCDVRLLLRANFRGAFLRRTAFVDGKIAAMWGLYCNGISDTAQPYFLTTPEIETTPVACVKEGKRAVADMLSVARHLEGFVDASYDKACRLLEVLGFHLGEPEPYGPRAELFRKFTLSRGE